MAKNGSGCSVNGMYKYMTPSYVAEDGQQAASYRALLDSLVENSSAHGLPTFYRAIGGFKKCFWVVVMIGMASVLMYNVVELTKKYLDYPISVKLNVDHQPQLTFPAVTVCNMSPVKKSSLQAAQNSASKRRKKRSSGGGACPNSDWYYYNRYCYLPSTINGTLGQTWSYCWGQGGGTKITSISDQQELDFVISISTHIATTNYWIALYKHTPTVNSTSWWFDGNPSTFRNWSSGEPDETNRCFAYDVGGFLDTHCNQDYYTVCRKEAIIVTTESSTEAATTTTVATSITSSISTTISSTEPGTSTTSEPTSTSEMTSTSMTSVPMTSTAEVSTTTSDVVTTTLPVTTTTEITSSVPTTKTTRETTTSVEETTTAQLTTTTLPETTTQPKTTTTSELTTTLLTTTPTETTTTLQPTTTSEEQTATSSAHHSTTPTTTMQDTTTFLATTTTEEPTTTSKELPVHCCCRCCYDVTSSPLTSSCTVCGRESLVDASQCASHPPPSPTTFTRPTEPNFEPPAQLEGSKFPDRLAVTPEFAAKEQLTESLAALPVTEKTAFGFTTADFILECSYDSHACNMDMDFSVFYNPIHGNCFVYNSGWNSSVQLKYSTKSGRRHGLAMTMNIQQDEYVTEAGDTAGIVVVIQPQNQMPFPEDDGTLVSPGFATSIAVVQKMVERQPAPYGKCQKMKDVDAKKNAYAELYAVNYTARACEKTCYQRNVIEQCQCTDAYFPPSNASAFNYVNVPVCSTSNITQDDCRYNVFQQFLRGEIDCDCPERCSDTLYETQTSLYMWPSRNTQTRILSALKSKLGPQFKQEMINDNLLKLEIYYKEFNFENIKEIPAYSYISDSGGVLGLWFGFAIMTFIEFFEFFVDLIVLTVFKITTACRK